MLLAGCTTKPVATTYWTQKGGLVVVHHVVGNIDTTEKLEPEQLSEDKRKATDLPNGKYFEILEGHDRTIREPAAVNKPERSKQDSWADVSSQLRELKGQVAAVKEQNRRLQDEMNVSESQKSPQLQPPERQVDAQPDVRLSQ
jgi:hypothetical protein